MPDFIPNDKKLAELMKKSRLEMPFSDFEDKVMYKIKERVKAKKFILKNISLACLFFVLGTGFGTAVCFFLPELISHSIPVSAGKILLTFQAAFVLVVLTQLEYLIKLVRKYGSI